MGQDFDIDWRSIEEDWRHAFYTEFRVDPEDHVILLLVAPLSPRADREQATQIMLTTFGVRAVHVATQAAASLCAAGCTMGIVMDFGGGGVSRTVPIYEGYALQYADSRLDLADRAPADHLKQVIEKRADAVTTDIEKLKARGVIAELDCVAQDIEDEDKAAHGATSYELLHGSAIAVCRMHLYMAEALLMPKLGGKEASGIYDTTLRAIVKCFEDWAK